MSKNVTTAKYNINFKDPSARILEISLDFKALQKNTELSMPRWIPGSYTLREFAKNIISISAIQGNKNLIITKMNPYSFKLNNKIGDLKIIYQIYANDLSVRGCYFDDHYSLLNGAGLFLQINNHQDYNYQVIVTKPGYKFARKWRIATLMPKIISDYYDLLDYPILLADFVTSEFLVNNVKHKIIINLGYSIEINQDYLDKQINVLTNDVKQICQAQIKFFKKAPFSEYMFILTLADTGYGGLEHKNSTVLQAQTICLPNLSLKNPQVDQNYQILLGLFSHEYFHAWNVKRITPKSFYQPNLTDLVDTSYLWFFEGATAYYDDWFLQKSKVISKEAYIAGLQENLNKSLQTPGRLRQSVLQAAQDCWIKLYQPHPNSINHMVSYYTKGALSILILDLLIIKYSDAKYSMHDVFLKLFKDYEAGCKYLNPNDLENIITDFAGKKNFKLFFDLISKPCDLLNIYQKLLPEFGVAIKLNNQDQTKYNFGFELDLITSIYPKITKVLDGSPAFKAGLFVDDEIVAINNIKINQVNYATYLANNFYIDPNAPLLNIAYFRQNKLNFTKLVPTKNDLKSVTLSLQNAKKAKNQLHQEVLKRLNKWLGV